VTVESMPEPAWQEYVRQLSSRATDLEHNLESRVRYQSLFDAIDACHQIYDLLTEVRNAALTRAADTERDFLTVAIGIGLDQVTTAMSHGFEVYGQELDPMKYRLKVAVAIARYAAGRLS
jgi:hypothetical protein